MEKVDEARALLKMLGLPKEQSNELAAYVLLALAKVDPLSQWSAATNEMYTTRELMDFIDNAYGKKYAANSRETIRRKALHQFEQAQLVTRNSDNPQRATNSPHNNYSLTEVCQGILHEYPDGDWKKEISNYLVNFGSLKEQYEKSNDAERIPIRLPNGREIKLSPGEHNELHSQIVHEFIPRFVKGNPILLYIGDTASSRADEGGKLLVNETEYLLSLGISPMSHSKLPDIVIYDPDKNWLFLVEAVTSHGPVSPKRHRELEKALEKCTAGRVYVTAFPDIVRFKKYANEIAWETEVWISDMPGHMIHFNGDRFLGPR